MTALVRLRSSFGNLVLVPVLRGQVPPLADCHLIAMVEGGSAKEAILTAKEK